VWIKLGREVENWETSQSMNSIFRALKFSVFGILLECWIGLTHH